MKLNKKANKLTISRKEWEDMGKKAGWNPLKGKPVSIETMTPIVLDIIKKTRKFPKPVDVALHFIRDNEYETPELEHQNIVNAAKQAILHWKTKIGDDPNSIMEAI